MGSVKFGKAGLCLFPLSHGGPALLCSQLDESSRNKNQDVWPTAPSPGCLGDVQGGCSPSEGLLGGVVVERGRHVRSLLQLIVFQVKLLGEAERMIRTLADDRSRKDDQGDSG